MVGAGLLAEASYHRDMVNEGWMRVRFLRTRAMAPDPAARQVHNENRAKHCGNFVTNCAWKCG